MPPGLICDTMPRKYVKIIRRDLQETAEAFDARINEFLEGIAEFELDSYDYSGPSEYMPESFVFIYGKPDPKPEAKP
jgi:hypothetical protein